MRTEIQLLNEIVNLLPSGKTLRFDMTRTNKHWLLDYEYFYVSKDLTLERLNLSTFRRAFSEGIFRSLDNNLSPYEFLNQEFTHSIKKYWKYKIEIGHVELVAWSKFTVEQDTGICYLYDDQNDFLGLYCHCMNRVEEFIYLGQSLTNFFDLKSTEKFLNENKQEDDFLVHKLKLSKSQLLNYDKYLERHEFEILDSELGLVVNLELYKNLIDNTFIPLSGNELSYSKLELISNKGSLNFLWHIDEYNQEINLDNNTDYIDPKIYIYMNQILEHLGSEKRFVLFRDFDFGQEYGLAFVGKRKREGLKKLFRVEVIEEQ